MPGYTYIMGSDTGVLYIGVTSKREQRIRQHKTGTFEGFSKTYACHRLLYSEYHEDIRTAIAREKQLKGWRREKKLNLIRTTNPEFKDLAEQWGWKFITPHERIADQNNHPNPPTIRHAERSSLRTSQAAQPKHLPPSPHPHDTETLSTTKTANRISRLKDQFKDLRTKEFLFS